MVTTTSEDKKRCRNTHVQLQGGGGGEKKKRSEIELSTRGTTLPAALRVGSSGSRVPPFVFQTLLEPHPLHLAIQPEPFGGPHLGLSCSALAQLSFPSAYLDLFVRLRPAGTQLIVIVMKKKGEL